MKRLLVATTNPHKLREIRGLLAHVPVAIVDLGSLPPIEEPEETGATFEENARAKALYYSSSVGRKIDLLVAEDSGLVIDALDGEPGIHSARFLGPHATYPERFAEIFRRLDARPERPRTARFICAGEPEDVVRGDEERRTTSCRAVLRSSPRYRPRAAIVSSARVQRGGQGRPDGLTAREAGLAPSGLAGETSFSSLRSWCIRTAQTHHPGF
jgi:non-canonical purine NTP pyrophosphatase (RdgB/HAM1 family)